MLVGLLILYVVMEAVLIDSSLSIRHVPVLDFIGGLLVGFSVYTNGSKLLRGSQTQDLGCLHGMRFLSMTWVILGHTYVFAVLPLLGGTNLTSKL